ncbi:MAG: hypothetical protein ACTSUV_05855 [Candidatus Ranarchaeia archaeon]
MMDNSLRVNYGGSFTIVSIIGILFTFISLFINFIFYTDNSSLSLVPYSPSDIPKMPLIHLAIFILGILSFSGLVIPVLGVVLGSYNISKGERKSWLIVFFNVLGFILHFNGPAFALVQYL